MYLKSMLKHTAGGLEGDLSCYSTGSSSEDQIFIPSLQSPVTLALGDLTHSGFHRYQVYVWYRDMHADKVPVYIM